MRGSATSDSVSLATRGIVMNIDKTLGYGTTSSVPERNYISQTSNIPVTKKVNVKAWKPEFRKLSGAGLKRLKRLLESGVPMEEARIKAMMPYSVLNAPKPAPLNPSPSSSSSAVAEKVNNAVTGLECPGIIMGIMHSDHPKSRLTNPERTAVEEMIVDKIVELGRGGSLRPKFLKMLHGDGFLEITCADRETAEWLKRLEHKLKPWKGATIVVKEDKVYSPRKTLVGYFPFRERDNVEKLLKLIDAQNDGIYSYTWDILEEQPVDHYKLKLVFSVDLECLKKLKLKNFEINYQFGQVKLEILGSEGEIQASLSTNQISSNNSMSSSYASSSMPPKPFSTNPFRL